MKGQEQVNVTYRITDNGSIRDVQPYINALNAANMKYHRLKNTRYTIIFDTGVKVELFSAAELIAAGKQINLADYPDSFDSSRQEPVFSLGQNNYIMEMHRPVTKTDR
jgi:hypothetical protein